MPMKTDGTRTDQIGWPSDQDLRLCREMCQQAGLLPSQLDNRNQLAYEASNEKALSEIAASLAANDYYLVSMVGNDEQDKNLGYPSCLYYIFSHPMLNLFLTIVYRFKYGQVYYPSIRPFFGGVEPFEREVMDLLGWIPEQQVIAHAHGARLHEGCYPAQLHPLRRDKSIAEIVLEVQDYIAKGCPKQVPDQTEGRVAAEPSKSTDGEMLIPVGPIHAGVIEPGHFLFHLTGEKVNRVDIKLGYTHKGIERLFQEYSVADEQGVRLAESISGDSAFSHSLAYCRAVENLVNVTIPFPARLLRALLLEMERIGNHVADSGALAHDVGMDLLSSDLAALRERMQELNRIVTGHRLLMGANLLGGVSLQEPLNKKMIEQQVDTLGSQFRRLSQTLGTSRAFLRRTVGVGVVDRAAALRSGATGMVARSAGVPRDFRINHADPDGIYTSTELIGVISNGSVRARGLGTQSGDVQARFVDRVEQVDISLKLIEKILRQWDDRWKDRQFASEMNLPDGIVRQVALGTVESWRGDIVYWLNVDEKGHIYRCKVRDPSMLNWPLLEDAVQGNYLFDFPLINKSFNLSYSGNDL